MRGTNDRKLQFVMSRYRTLSILAFPIVLTIGIVLIPVVTDYNDHRLAEAAVGQTTRWFAGHLTAAIGFALAILAVGTIDRIVQGTAHALPLMTQPMIALGVGLYAAGLGADGIGPVAVQTAGHSPVIFFDGGFWVTGTFIAGTLLFGLGLLSMVISAARSHLLHGWQSYLCQLSAIFFLVGPAILSGWVLYGVALAAFGVFVPFYLVLSHKVESI